MRTQCAVLVCVLSLAASGAATAQEPGHAGIVMGYPASLGFIFRVNDAVAVRPELTVAWTSVGGTDITGGTSNWQVGVGASGLFYFARHDNLRPYFSPQWTFTHLSSSSTVSTNHANMVAGMFGAQYSLGSRFAVFGETGLGYTRSTTTSTLSIGSFSLSTTRHVDLVGTRGRVGVIVYF